MKESSVSREAGGLWTGNLPGFHHAVDIRRCNRTPDLSTTNALLEVPRHPSDLGAYQKTPTSAQGRIKLTSPSAALGISLNVLTLLKNLCVL